MHWRMGVAAPSSLPVLHRCGGMGGSAPSSLPVLNSGCDIGASANRRCRRCRVYTAAAPFAHLSHRRCRFYWGRRNRRFCSTSAQPEHHALPRQTPSPSPAQTAPASPPPPRVPLLFWHYLVGFFLLPLCVPIAIVSVCICVGLCWRAYLSLEVRIYVCWCMWVCMIVRACARGCACARVWAYVCVGLWVGTLSMRVRAGVWMHM